MNLPMDPNDVGYTPEGQERVERNKRVKEQLEDLRIMQEDQDWVEQYYLRRRRP